MRQRGADDDTETWKSRLDAARELSAILGERITGITLNRWRKDPTCPLDAGRGPIPKAPLIQWAFTQRRRAGRPRSAVIPAVQGEAAGEGEDSLRVRLLEEQVRNLEIKNGRLAEETVPVDDVKAAIVQAMNGLRSELVNDLPVDLWSACQGKPVEEATNAIREMLIAALNRFSTAAGKVAEK